MVDDYPQGDMVPEGLFQLALRHMTKGDWPGAVALLSQLGRLPRIANREDVEQAERQVYFLARAQFQVGQCDVALEALDSACTRAPI